MLLQPGAARGRRVLLGHQESKGRNLHGGSWGQSHMAGGDGFYLGLYLHGETSQLCPELGSGWRWLAPVFILKPRYQAGPRGDLGPHGSGGSMG